MAESRVEILNRIILAYIEARAILIREKYTGKDFRVFDMCSEAIVKAWESKKEEV